MTIAEAVTQFDACYSKHRQIGDTKKDFYCGITNDIERREQEHHANFLYHVEANNSDVAKKLETKLHNAGYDTGDKLGNGSDDSIYVYMYRKHSFTKE